MAKRRIDVFAVPEDPRQVGPLIKADSGIPSDIVCSGVMGNPHNDSDRPGRDPDGEKYGGIRDVLAGQSSSQAYGSWGGLRDYNDPMQQKRNKAREAQD